MPIYRGTGGSGNASTDAYASQVAEYANTATTKANEAAASATAAAASATAAAASEAGVDADRVAAEAAKVAAQASQAAAATSETNSATSATNAANSATSASTSATNAANSATAASASETASAASASSAATSATTATTQASNASTSASQAATSATAASASATAASTSETNAAASAANAATSETNASTSESNAATSATSAATSASNASTSETNASASASAASTAASSATASASAASTSATSAAASQSAAATSASNASTSETNAANSASSAATSATNAANSATAAAASETSAEGHKDLAYTYWQNAASAVTYSDLEAIAASKAVTAVDVFVYDTSKDSDGGAWRKRTQHTSWYNETLNTATRGARKEFPAVAVIVADTSKDITIYDGDDPTLPMWKKFNHTVTWTGIAAVNGLIAFSGITNSLFRLDFVADNVRFNKAASNERQRDCLYDWSNTAPFYYNGNTNRLVNDIANDVAMTVLPNAPIDPATGLPVPTIAVATDGGVSVIKDDGSVVDSQFTNAINSIYFDERGVIWQGRDNTHQVRFSSTYDADGFTQDYYTDITTVKLAPLASKIQEVLGGACGFDTSLVTLDHDSSNKDNSMVAYITSDYNTGWMHGDIKGAFLSDTTAETVVGSELVTNGTFDVNTSGWTASNAILSSASGELKVTDIVADANANQTITTEVGKTYVLTGQARAPSANTSVNAGSITFGNVTTTITAEDVTQNIVITYTATGLSTAIKLQVNGGTTGDICYFDNISVRLADSDRSVNNNGLEVHGQITKTAVATGADLVAYSGFSADDYLEQPYNSDLDFGTGDFYVMGWFKRPSELNGTFIAKGNHDLLGGWSFQISSANYRLRTNASDYLTTAVPSSYNTWFNVALVRSGNTLSLYQNGSLISSVTMGLTLSLTDVLTLGRRNPANNAIPFNGSLALWRIGAGAPTAAQIAKIYEDEKVLFQEGAQATLYGTSDAVTALAYDEVTDLLHVGTSAGRSVFSGLRRVENTTDAVGTAISAVNGMVVEE